MRSNVLPLEHVPKLLALGQCCAFREFHSEQDEAHVGLGVCWPQEASFTSVNYLQWCMGPAAGKPFCFWLQPHICFPRRIRHCEKLRKRNGGFDVCFWLLFVQDTPTPERKELELGFIIHLWGLEKQYINLWTQSDRKHKRKEEKMNTRFHLSVCMWYIQMPHRSSGWTECWALATQQTVEP